MNDAENAEQTTAEFVYTPEQQDKDGTNARSAAYRTVRDDVGLPVDTDEKPSSEAKAIHKAAGEAARVSVTAIEKAITAKKKRDEWTPDQTKAAHQLMLDKGLDAYVGVLETEGYEVDEHLREKAISAYETRLIERRHKAEAEWKTKQAASEEIDNIFA